MDRLVFAIAAAMLSTSAMSQTYLCIADHTTGFKYNKDTKQWHETNFKAGDKYLVTKSKSSSKAWEVKEFGRDYTLDKCSEGFQSGAMVCDDGLFRMNRHALRFVRVFPHGYWFMNDPKSELGSFRDDGGDTPYIEIGKCSLL